MRPDRIREQQRALKEAKELDPSLGESS